ncbi:hypothetical protein QYF36_008526 [Acer negundo]|nr:hypothetical protein QYF36_008526 [Acer negundo]
MATSIYFVGLYCFLLLLCLVYSLKEGYAFEELKESSRADTFQVSSLFASSICNHSTKANERESTFRIVDKYGPCFQPNPRTTPSQTDILRFDRARINSIHARLSKNSGGHHRDMIKLNSASIPATDGSLFQTSNFVVKVGLGTPKKELSLVLDTGSDLTWTQCLPCESSQTCYKQKEPLFDRTKSSTYLTISKTDSVCKYVHRPVTVPTIAASLCFYGVRYSDEDSSTSTGFFSKETLTLSKDKINGFLFGCGINQKGDFNLEAGMMGLNQEEASIVSQTADTCYDLSKTTSVKVPEISFFFKDGKVVGMPGKSSLVTYSKTNSQVCLGFAPYEKGDEETIIGNQVQRTMEVVYDVARQRIGFSRKGCT